MTPPTKQAVVEYFESKGYRGEVGEKAFNYYEAADWHDSKGKKVKCWKQKMIGVWFTPENEVGYEKDSKHSTSLGRAKAAIQRRRNRAI